MSCHGRTEVILRVGRALRVQHGDVLYHHKELGRKAQVGFLGLHAASTATPVARATSSPERATQLGLRRSEVLLSQGSEVGDRIMTGCSTRARLLRPPLAGRSAPRIEKRAFITAERQARLNDSPQKTTTIQTTLLRAASSSYCRTISPLVGDLARSRDKSRRE